MLRFLIYLPFFIVFSFLSLKLTYTEFSELILLGSVILFFSFMGQLGFTTDNSVSASNLKIQTRKRLKSKSRYKKINAADIWEMSYYSFYLSTIVFSLIGGLIVHLYFKNYNVSALSGWTIFIVSQTLYLQKQMKSIGIDNTRHFITYGLPSILFIISSLLSKKNLYANTAEFNISIFSTVFLFVNLTQFLILKIFTPKIRVTRNNRLRRKIFLNICDSRIKNIKADISIPFGIFLFTIGNLFLPNDIDSVFILSIGFALALLIYLMPVSLRLRSIVMTLLTPTLFLLIGGFQVFRQYYSEEIFITSFLLFGLFAIYEHMGIHIKKHFRKISLFILMITGIIFIPTLSMYGSILILYLLLASIKYNGGAEAPPSSSL